MIFEFFNSSVLKKDINPIRSKEGNIAPQDFWKAILIWHNTGYGLKPPSLPRYTLPTVSTEKSSEVYLRY